MTSPTSTFEKIERINLALAVLDAIENNKDHPVLEKRDSAVMHALARRLCDNADSETDWIVRQYSERQKNKVFACINSLDHNDIRESMVALAQNKPLKEIEAATRMPWQVAAVLLEAFDILCDPDEADLYASIFTVVHGDQK
jgi:hypothetical protein